MASSGRFSKYPKVNRSIPAAPASAADRLALASTPAPAPKPVVAAPVAVPALEDMTVAEVLEWVGDDDKRRQAALAAEQDGRARKGLIKTLSE